MIWLITAVIGLAIGGGIVYDMRRSAKQKADLASGDTTVHTRQPAPGYGIRTLKYSDRDPWL